MGFVYRKATISDSERIAGLFEEMLRTIYHTENADIRIMRIRGNAS